MRWRALGILSAVVVSPVFGGTIRHDVNDSSYTALAAESRYASVGAVLFNRSGSGTIGSGALIAPDWVLTAGHVVAGTDLLGGGITDMRFVLGPNAAQPAITADDWIPLPGWNGNTDSGLDVGLIHLSSDILSVNPAERYFGTTLKTLTGTHVGYGKSGTGISGHTIGPGIKRAGNNVIDRFGNEVEPGYSSNIIMSDFDQPGVPAESSMGSSSPLAMEYQIALGDSGGPVFIDSNGESLVAAVHSFLRWIDGTGDADYGDQAGSVRLNGIWNGTKTINDWVSSMITVAGDADADFDVDIDDLNQLANNYGPLGGGHWHLGDFDLDGDVDLNDLSSLAANYGSGEAQAFADFSSMGSVPEPAGLAALSITAILLRRRRQA